MAHAARVLTPADLDRDVIDKVKIGLLDMLSCAFESQDLPWGCQAIEMVSRGAEGSTAGRHGIASIIGTPFRVSTSEAAFVNGTLGHGLVREDMHTGSVSHLGVVIYPVLLALSQRRPVHGSMFILAAASGYEIAAAIGRALIDADFVRFHRPTGTTGPIGAAAAGGILLGLSEDAIVSAIGLAANTASGLNEWPFSGGEEMFFHPGFAAGNAVTAVELAELGAFASETALDGQSGLFAALTRADRINRVKPFHSGLSEILSVFHKPAPACNYAQTACQAALILAAQDGIKAADIQHVHVRCSAAAVAYPGCNYTGPFNRILQAKMSVQYCVAATLAFGKIAESNYRVLDAPEVMRLAYSTTLEPGTEFTEAYPDKQGAEVTVRLRNGETHGRRLDDVVAATPGEIRERFRVACPWAERIEKFIDELEHQDDAGSLGRLLEKD